MGNLRQTVLHNAELYENETRKNENKVRGGLHAHGMSIGVGGDLIIYGGDINGYEYRAQHANQFYTIEISPKTSLDLIANLQNTFDAFRDFPTL